MEKENKPLNEKDVEEFLMSHAEKMQKAIIQEIKQGYITKNGDKIIWNDRFRIRLQEIEEVEARHKQAVKEAYEELRINLCVCTNAELLQWKECVCCGELKRVFKDKFGFELF